MVTGDDLAFVRLAMRKRLVSAQRIREAVERKKWDSKDRTLAEILIDMGALDPGMVKKLASEIGALGRQTVSSGGQKNATVLSGRRTDPSLEKSEPAHADERTHQEPAPKHPRRVGRYEIVRLIGAGAMGAVYEARDRELDKTIALKLLAGEGAPSARAIARFRREAKLAARLDHPNIVRVYGAGFEDNHHFIAMDLVDGRSLAELVAIGEVPPRRAIHLARKIAVAMQHAHDRGVLHRDLKPANVLVDQDGEPRVTDFGLAVLAEPEESDRLTRTGAAVGTPAYMSPEQARGDLQDIDPRSDVYALGATLYEMLTGGPPFEAPTFLELAKKICEAEPPSPRKKNPEVPEDLETICLKALEKEKEDRYASAADMAADLARLIEDAPIVAKPPSPAVRAKRWAARHPGFAATIAALVLLNIAGGIRMYIQPGYVTIYTAPAGAKVYIDGAYIGTNVVEHPVHAGRHELRFGYDEKYDPTPTRFDVDRGHNAPFLVRLVHEDGTLAVRASHAIEGAMVTITQAHDGKFVGRQLAPFDKLLKPGDYIVSAAKESFVSSGPIQVHIEKGAVLELRLPDLAAEKSELDLEVEPRGAEVRAEGARDWQVATDGLLQLKREGSFEVEVRKAGYLPRTVTARVPRDRRRRVVLPPARASSRPLGGTLVAAPVAADVDGDGAPDVFTLEEDEEGRWLALSGGGEEGRRWRVRTDARAILPFLADADQDGILDVALETRTGVSVRDGAHGTPIVALQVAPAVGDAPPDGAVRTTCFPTKSRQGIRSMGVLALRYGAGDVENVRVAVWVDGQGYTPLALSCPQLREGLGSAPIVISSAELGGEAPTGYSVFLALKKKILRIDLPLDAPKGKDYVEVRGRPLEVSESTGAGELAALPLAGKGSALLLCPESGPLLVLDRETGKVLARWAPGPGVPRLRDLRVVPLEKNWYGISVRERGEGGRSVGHVVRWNAVRGELRDHFARDREDPVCLPADEPWAPAKQRRDESTVWVRGGVFDLRGNALGERSAETQLWARDGLNAVADLDGSGAAQVLASSPDGRSLVVLAPVSAQRWRSPAGGCIASVTGDLDGEKALVVVTRDHVTALGATDGRTLWSKPAPAGARAVALMRTRRGRDVIVLGEKVVQRFDGRDGTSVWEEKNDIPAARTVESLGEDACGCGEEDLLLGDPLTLLKGRSGKVVKTVGGVPPMGAPPVGPLVIEGDRGKRQIVARVAAGGESGPCELVRLMATREGFVEDPIRIPLAASAGPLAALAPTASGTPAILVVANGTDLTFLLDRAQPLDVGHVVAARAPAPPDAAAPLVLLSEDKGGWTLRGVGRTSDGGEVLWARRLPAGRRTPSGPVFFDHGARLAVLAPSGVVAILAAKDGAWLGERRAPEGELEALVAGYDLPEAGGATVVALTSDGDLVAFDAATRSTGAATDPRSEVQELSRRVALGRSFATQVVSRLSNSSWASSGPAQYVLAQSYLALEQPGLALAAVEKAIELRHPAAQALKVKALVQQARTDRKEVDFDQSLAALSDLLLQRPEVAAETALDLAQAVADEDEAAGAPMGAEAESNHKARINAARKLIEFVVHVVPTDARARALKVELMLRFVAATEKDPRYAELEVRDRQIQWIREDALVALNDPAYARSSPLHAIAALCAYTLGSDDLGRRMTSDAEFRLHARQVHDGLEEELAKIDAALAEAYDSRQPDRRWAEQYDALAGLAKKRKEWAAFLGVTKKAIQKRQQKELGRGR